MDKTNLVSNRRNLLGTIFLSPAEDRLRAGWRLLLQSILILIFSIPAGIAFFLPIGLLKINFGSPWALLANELTMLVSITAATFLARRFLDNRSLVSLGLALNIQAAKDTVAGILISFLQIGLIFGLELIFGWTKLEGFAWQNSSSSIVLAGTGVWLLIFLCTGWLEELLSRGYHLQTIESGSNIIWAVLFSSSVFAVLHLFNPGAGWISTLGIFLAGLFLALPYLLTGQLWLSIGLHIGWNFFEGVVFGFPVSGITTFRLVQHQVDGPELWTGGLFGPEAGLLVIPALLLGCILLAGYVKTGLGKQKQD